MADQQMALTRSTRAGSSLNKTARQVVPQFLQKIYEMVNDPANSELIRWSDTGDSFYVLDHERFAREVLGRWFKHQNFSSFVRQLNMYGFHKIPHLQQGVLKSDSEAEFWNFEHPNFHRGQPDLLCLIQRKKQATQGDEQSQVEMPNVTHLGSPSVSGNLSAGQILDINSIVSGIAAIKRHQTAISTDLNELKTSNQHLWQEAMTARERHKKHQDTINRILKFLAGVFGHQANPMHKDDGGHSPSHGVVPRIPQRLLIGDGRDAKGKGININDIDNDRKNRTHFDRDRSPATSDRFASIESPLQPPMPMLSMPPSTIAPSDTFSPAPSASTPRFSSVPPPPSRTDISHKESPGPTPHPNADNTIYPLTPNERPLYDAYTQQQPQQHVQSIGSNQLTTKSPGTPTPDAMLQNAFAQMLQSPGQMQRLLAALASQSMNPMPEPPPMGIPQPLQQLQHYDPTIDYSRGYNPDQINPQYASASSMPLPVTSPSLHQHDELSAYEHIAEDHNRLQKTYRDAAEIEEDVNALHSSINSLIESLGMDPSMMESSHGQDASTQEQSVINPHDPVLPSTRVLDNEATDPSTQDFDFDQFLTNLTHGDEDTDYTQLADKLDHSTRNDSSAPINTPSPEQLTAFLDDVQSTSDGTISPVTNFRHHSPEYQIKRGSKRKSDVAGILTEEHSTGRRPNKQSSPGSKSKRKR